MSTVLYIAVVNHEPEAGYHATLTDLPDCEARGKDLAGLIVDARQAVTARLEAYENAGEAWPEPTAIEHVSAPAGALTIPIDVAVDDPPIRVNISMGERLVQRLDAAAELRGMTRSGFIAQSVKAALGESARPLGEGEQWSRKLQDELSAIGRRINDSLGPDSSFTRRMNELDGMAMEGVRKAADAVSAAMTRKREPTSPPADHADPNV